MNWNYHIHISVSSALKPLKNAARMGNSMLVLMLNRHKTSNFFTYVHTNLGRMGLIYYHSDHSGTTTENVNHYEMNDEG